MRASEDAKPDSLTRPRAAAFPERDETCACLPFVMPLLPPSSPCAAPQPTRVSR
ncbi:fimbrial assembly chaperone domain protein [Burkholderia pseudomallei]|nr:fimbrial assembly chaperone domain protein [Burkholderia pseudomallei]